MDVNVHFKDIPDGKLADMIEMFLLIYFQQDAIIHSLFISVILLYIFRVVFPPIIRSTYNCIYSIWYLSNRYCYLLLLWKSWNQFECGVGIVLICLVLCNRTKTDDNRTRMTNTYCFYIVLKYPDDGEWTYPKHVEYFIK